MKSSWQRKPSKTLAGSQVLDERRGLKATVDIQVQATGIDFPYYSLINPEVLVQITTPSA
jgi:hypothetical protein